MKNHLAKTLSVALLTFALAAQARALTLEIHDRNRVVRTFDLPTPPANENVGAVTVDAFVGLGVPFEGSAGGISAIYGQGSDLEVLSDKAMKAWGWCFSIDGHVSDKMPDQVPLDPSAKTLKWFYAYALYDSGTWTGYCIQDQ